MAVTHEQIMARIRERLEAIKLLADDPEAAHSAEDSLWEYALTVIYNGAEKPEEIAGEVLRTLDIEFPRWCA